MAKRKFTAGERSTAINLYQQGLSDTKIAGLLKRTRGSLSNILRRESPQEPDWPEITKDPNAFTSWGKGFWDDNLIMKDSKKRR